MDRYYSVPVVFANMNGNKLFHARFLSDSDQGTRKYDEKCQCRRLHSYMKKANVAKTATRMILELELTKYLSEDMLHDEAVVPALLGVREGEVSPTV